MRLTFCSTMRMVNPSDRAVGRIRSKTSAASFGDRPSEGSSSSNSSRPGLETAGKRQHLCFTAAQTGRRPIQLVRESGKQPVKVRSCCAVEARNPPRPVCRNAEILLDAQGSEDQAPFRNLHDAPGDDGCVWARPPIDSPSNRISPPSGATDSPEMAFRIEVLPAPFIPMMDTISPAPHLQGDSVNGTHVRRRRPLSRRTSRTGVHRLVPR